MTGFRMACACLFVLFALTGADGEERAAEPMSSEESDAAITLFTNWIRDKPSADNFLNRGNCYAVRGDYDKAIADFSEAMRIEPKNLRPILYRASVHSFRKDYDKAIADLTEAIKIDPTSVSAFQYRGTAYLMKKDSEKALADFAEIIRLTPKNALGYMLRAQAFIIRKEYDKAIADFTEVVRQNPADSFALKMRSTTYFTKKDYESAVVDTTELIRLNSTEPRAFLQRAMIYFSKKDYENALRDFSEAIRLDPSYPLAYRNVAAVLSTCPKDNIRNGKKAVEYAIRACELSNWKNSECLDSLASSYAECGEFTQAIKWEKKALEIGFGDKEQDQKNRDRLKLYEENKPFREE